MTEAEINEKQQDLEIRERNLQTMHKLYADYTSITDTQTMHKLSSIIAPKVVAAMKSHICVQGERFSKIEGKIDTIISNQTETKKDTKEVLGELITAKNEHAKKIKGLETTNKVLAGIGGIFIMAWTAGRLIFK